MLIPDVNIFVEAFRGEGNARDWIERNRGGKRAIGIFMDVAASTVRILTHPKIWPHPAHAHEVVDLFDQLVRSPAVKVIQESVATRVMELDATLVTKDKGFTRFAGLKIHLL